MPQAVHRPAAGAPKFGAAALGQGHIEGVVGPFAAQPLSPGQCGRQGLPRLFGGKYAVPNGPPQTGGYFSRSFVSRRRGRHSPC